MVADEKEPQKNTWGNLDDEKARWEAASESVIDPLTHPETMSSEGDIARWEITINQLESVGIMDPEEAKDMRNRILKWHREG